MAQDRIIIDSISLNRQDIKRLRDIANELEKACKLCNGLNIPIRSVNNSEWELCDGWDGERIDK